MGEMAGSNRQQPETIALSLTILELLLETGFICGLLCKIMLRRIPPPHRTRKVGHLARRLFSRSSTGEDARRSIYAVKITPTCSVITDPIFQQPYLRVWALEVRRLRVSTFPAWTACGRSHFC